MDYSSLVYKGLWPDATCCDQVLRILPDGEWIVIFMTGGQTEPAPENHIVLCRSPDQGTTWGAPEDVLRLPDRATTLTEVLVHDGAIIVHVQIHRGCFDDWRNATVVSRDAGRTWSAPREFSALPRRAMIRNTLCASWGTWYMPFQHYVSLGDPAASVLEDGSFTNPEIGVVISDDGGETWRLSATVIGRSWAEGTLTELGDGRLVMLIRHNGSGCLWRSDSHDRGATWSIPARTGIPNPGSKARLWRLRDGRHVLVHNPNPMTGHPNSKIGASVNRNPLSLWISDDDLVSWSYRRDLTSFPGMLAYPDGVVSEDERWVHFVFDYNRHDVIHWSAALP
jgi:predicted neuraminidase